VTPTYLSRDGEQFGPFSSEQVHEMLQSGQVLPSDFYWQEGMAEWGVVSDNWQPVSTPAPSPPMPAASNRPALSARPNVSVSAKQSRSKDYPIAFVYTLVVSVVLLALAAAYLVFQSFQPSLDEDFNNVSEQAEILEPTPTPPHLASTPRQTPTPPAPSPTQTYTPVPLPAVWPSGDHLRVVAWNLEWYPGGGMDATPDEALAHEAKAKPELQCISPDIFLAQEIRSWSDFDRLVSTLNGLHTAVVSSFKLGREIGKQQAAIASKLPVNSAWYENWKAADPTPSRGFSAAVLEVPESNKLLLVYSVHLKSNLAKRDGDAEKNFRMREESVRQLVAHVRDMERLFEGRISGVIVGGDFNTNHDGQFGDATISMMVDAGFHNTWADTRAEARQTWRGGRRFKPTTLDYIFTKGIAPLSAQILEADASDHHPIEISVPIS
jgi:endonuclease/exonuclease/phosphatase family metal-dependent hydrolase